MMDDGTLASGAEDNLILLWNSHTKKPPTKKETKERKRDLLRPDITFMFADPLVNKDKYALKGVNYKSEMN